MERTFDEALKHLKERLLELGALVEDQIARSIRTLVERNSELARETIARDHQVNALEVGIDEECISLLARMQPMATDLRFITMAMKIVTDLERMGDLAVDVCERAIELNEEPQLKPYIDLPRMAAHAQRMVKEALDAFVNRDAELARKVCRDDDFIDDLNEQVFRELLSFMLEEPHTITRAIRLSFISKYLERIADHATNVAEMVVYLIEGKIIRHMAV